MKKIIFGLIILASISCSKQKEVFSLTGTTSGIENGTVLILEDTDTGEILDSALVNNNSFIFNTALKSSPVNAVFHSKDYANYRFVWLENNTMTFDATQTDFRNAQINGSETENKSFELSQLTDGMEKEKRRETEQDFIEKNPNNLISSSMLALYSTTWGKEKTIELYEQLSASNKSNTYGKKIAHFIILNKNPKIGEHFADFEMTDTNNTSKKLSDLKGKTVLLEFWASWCGPCIQENPNLVKTYEKFKPKGFEVFAVSLDKSKENWIKEIEKGNLNWEHVSELNGRDNTASLIYGINGIPDNFLIDHNGIIVGRNLRGDKLNEKLEEIMPTRNVLTK